MIKTDDLVTAQGYNGVFRVCSLSKDQKTAEIELCMSKQQPMHYRISMPAIALSPFSEDASQAAARRGYKRLMCVAPQPGDIKALLKGSH